LIKAGGTTGGMQTPLSRIPSSSAASGCKSGIFRALSSGGGFDCDLPIPSMTSNQHTVATVPGVTGVECKSLFHHPSFLSSPPFPRQGVVLLLRSFLQRLNSSTPPSSPCPPGNRWQRSKTKLRRNWAGARWVYPRCVSTTCPSSTARCASRRSSAPTIPLPSSRYVSERPGWTGGKGGRGKGVRTLGHEPDLSTLRDPL